MRNAYLLAAKIGIALVLLTCRIHAQCPPSTQPGIHIVQTGETLYSLSKKYGITLTQIYEWNNIALGDIIPLCKAIVVVQPVKKESFDIPEKTPPTTNTGSGEFVRPFESYRKQEGNRHVVGYAESVANLARLYGYTEEKFREMNDLKPNASVMEGQILSTCHCSGQKVDSPPNKNSPGISDDSDPYIKEEKKTNEPSKEQPTGYEEGAAKPPAAYMTSEELQMVNEINLLRANPPAYIKYVQDYINELQSGSQSRSAVVAARELIDELKSTPVLSTLTSSECIFRAARLHGEEQRPTGDINHQGRDGSWPWDRVLHECPQMQDGNENIVGGPSNIRRAVMLLLVDDGISNRGHRKALLNPDWKYVACYKVGQVGNISNVWIQNFGF